MRRMRERLTGPAGEDGSMTLFSVVMTLLILMIAGAAVDMMRHETVRASMQGTVDRAVLAAADLDQQRAPRTVVQDYLRRAGLADAMGAVSVDEGLNYRIVTASASGGVETPFLKLSGFDSLGVGVRATAEERIANVEIAMVLDVSGSMGSRGRIGNMRDAAREFVDAVIQPEEAPGMTTVSVVPYNANVNIGETLAPYFPLDEAHDYSHCAIFPDAAFDSTSVSPTGQLERLAHFDLQTGNENTAQIARPWCPTGDASALMVHSADRPALRRHIGNLGADGNTAIDLGMKWGVALLDPVFRPVVASLSRDGLAHAEADDRPAAWDDREAMKFVVVMTDGANTTQYDLRPEFKTGWSDIWIDDRGDTQPWNDRFSLRVRDGWGDDDLWFRERFEHDGWNRRYRDAPDGGSNARRMTNAELFARFSTQAVARRFYTQPYYDRFVSYGGWYDMYYAWQDTVDADEADDRLSRVCAAARDQGIVVFAIGFEAPSRGQAAMRDCASSPSHYFDVDGAALTETFHAIARQINSLRLVQ